MTTPKLEFKNDDFIKFSENLRRTATGVKFVRTLFTDPTRLSPTQITGILRSLGLDIPREVEISAQLAQIVISGNSLYQSYQDIEKLKDADSLNKMSFDTAQLSISLFKELKWIDKRQASLLRVGASVAMLFASAGTDVRAWITLGLETGLAGSSAQAEAKQLAAQAAGNWYRENINAQAFELQNSVQKLSKGEIGVFGFLAESSFKSNMLFDQCVLKNPALEPIRKLLPTLNFFPMWKVEANFEARTETWYGEGHRDNYYIDFMSSKDMTFDQAKQTMFVFDQVFKPMLQNYVNIQNDITLKRKCPLIDFSKLIALDNQDFYFDSKLDIQEKFRRQFATPSDLGLDLFSDLADKKEQYALRGLITATTKETSIADVKLADSMGFINPILKNTEARKKVDDFFNYQTVQWPIAYGIDPRNLANYIAFLDMVDMVKNDPFYQNLVDKSYMDKYLVYSGVDEWKAELDTLVTKTTIRKVNKLARENIASYLGVESKNLIKIDDGKINTPSVYRVKG